MKTYWEIITLLHCMYLFFIRSPEQKAPMSFPGKKLSVVRCRRGYRKLFKQTWHKTSLLVQMKGPAVFQEEINTKYRKYIDKF